MGLNENDLLELKMLTVSKYDGPQPIPFAFGCANASGITTRIGMTN